MSEEPVRSSPAAGGVAERQWAILVFVLASVPLAAMFLPPPPPVAFAWDTLMAIGGIAAGVMMVLPVATARLWLRWRRSAALARFVYCSHRALAYLAGALVLAHAAGLMLIEPHVLDYLELSAPGYMLGGVGATVCIAMLVATSLAAQRRRTPPGRWRMRHAALSAAAIVLTVVHLLGAGFYLAAPPRVAVLCLTAALPTLVSLWLGHRRGRRPMATRRPGVRPMRADLAAAGRRAHRAVTAMALAWAGATLACAAAGGLLAEPL